MYQPVIGLEIHSELKTKSKMFCSCLNNPDEKTPNLNICPVCMGHPGTLPVINQEAVKKTIKAGLALNCEIALEAKFDRKNYFYPDLPKGYQISQYDQPFCKNGYLEINGKKIRIRRIHLEEDTGKLIHPEGTDYSLVDFNRAGVPLMELVTEPDIESGREARDFAQELQLILRYLGVSNADMEKGQMRVEVNISLIQSDKFKDKILGTKVEIKNLNSFRSVEKAIDYEIERQKKILEKGGKIIQETRGWHDKKEITFAQREKEEAHDYRYFPEPDLPPLYLDKKFIEEVKFEIPELPAEKRKRFKEQYHLDEKAIETFVFNKDLSEYYEKVVSEFEEWIKEEGLKKDVSEKEEQRIFRLAANYILSDIKGLLGNEIFKEKDFKISPENFAEFIKMIYKGEISSKIAKMVLADMFESGADPSSIIKAKNLKQITDDQEIEKIIRKVVVQNSKAVEDYKKGKQNALQFLAGQVMAATRGTADPQKVQELLKKLL